MINADGGYVYINVLPLQSRAASESSTWSVFPAERGSVRFYSSLVSVSRYSESAGFRPQPAQVPELRQRFLQHCQRCIFVHAVSLNLLYLGTESPFCKVHLSLPRTRSNTRRVSQMGGLPGCWIMTGKESTNWNFHLDLWGWICFQWAFSQAFSLFQGSVWRASKQICWNKHFHSSQCPAVSSSYHHNTFMCVFSYLHWLSFCPYFDESVSF